MLIGQKGKLSKDREQKTTATLVKFGLLPFFSYPHAPTPQHGHAPSCMLLHHNGSIEELQERACGSQRQGVFLSSCLFVSKPACYRKGFFTSGVEDQNNIINMIDLISDI